MVGSKNQRKIDVAEKVFKEIMNTEKFEVLSCNSSSNVPETPYGKEIYEGAINRAYECIEHQKDADFYVGLESGLIERYGDVYEEAWSFVITRERREYAGYSSGLRLPDYVKKRMEETGLEHSDAMTVIEKELGLKNDTWSTYTGGIIPRTVSLEESLRNALIQIAANEKSLYNKRQ